MSEEIKQAPEAASSDLQAKINERIEELKLSIGKTYRRKDGMGHPVKITGYGGVLIHQEVRGGKHAAIQSHVFKTDSMWTPPATKFLEEYEVVASVETETKNNQPV